MSKSCFGSDVCVRNFSLKSKGICLFLNGYFKFMVKIQGSSFL